MAKKMLKKKVQRKPAAKEIAAPVMDSARDVWLAGLGAFSVAQQESGRIFEQGSKLFDRLVAEGADVIGSTPDELAAYMKSETEKWARVVKTAGIKTQ